MPITQMKNLRLNQILERITEKIRSLWPVTTGI